MAGEGDHVGTASQAVYRFSVVFNWVASMWPTLERPATPFGGSRATGRCDCRNTDDMGNDLDDVPGWERECNSGTFWVNRRGYTPGDETPYGDAFFELMDSVDQKYRTVLAAEVEAR